MRFDTFITATLITGAIVTTPVARAECDSSQTKCALKGGKCNIHFTNRTADAGGLDGKSNINQTTAIQAVRVKAIDSKGNKVGNKLVIQAGDTKTMNITKKANKQFDAIRLRSDNAGFMFGGTTMRCADIVAILNGNGKCKLFHGNRKASGNGRCKIFHGVHYNIHPAVNFYLGYQCDGGKIGGPTDARID